MYAIFISTVNKSNKTEMELWTVIMDLTQAINTANHNKKNYYFYCFRQQSPVFIDKTTS